MHSLMDSFLSCLKKNSNFSLKAFYANRLLSKSAEKVYLNVQSFSFPIWNRQLKQKLPTCGVTASY